MRVLPAVLLMACGASSCGGASTKTVTPPAQWVQVWSDEFDGAADTAPDAKTWSYDVGGSGWGNAQLEYDTDSTDNASLDGQGHLVISARRQSIDHNQYTSARLKTQGRFTQQYGRIEARLKLPTGRGLWPAFWLLGADIDTAPWPKCGEIDIMESRGQEPQVAIGSLHGPGYSGGSAITSRHRLDTGTFSDDFHVFAVEWDPTRIVFFVDDVAYQTVSAEAVLGKGDWAFDHPFFIILNVAVGGNFVGAPDSTTTFPQQMVVDWVRVWRRG